MSLTRDSHLAIPEDTGAADVTISAHLLKAYVINQNMTKAATVVVRVRYESPKFAAIEQVYRGSDDGLNWIGGTDETQSALDTSLSRALNQIDSDLIAYCEQGRSNAS